MNPGSRTTLGVSAGNGMIHCALMTVDDLGHLSTDSRVIDVDPTDRLDRAGRVNSGIDLMLDRARRNNASVGSIGVACRTTGQGREIASRGVGPRRQIHLVGDAESVARALAESGEIARHPEVTVVDCGDSGVTMFRLDTATGVIADVVRSTAISGFALDTALADTVAAETGSMSSRAGWAALVSGCRTAKEDLSLGDSTTFAVAGVARQMSMGMLASAIAPMAQALAGEIAAHADADAGTASTPLVLVGGLANIPALHEVLGRESAAPIIRPESPELLCALGAALLSRSGVTASSRLAFIGGRRHSDWLSAMPLAVVGAGLAGTMLTVYAVGAALTGNSTPEVPTPTAPATSIVGAPAANLPPTTDAPTERTPTSVVVSVPTSTRAPQSGPGEPTETTVTVAPTPATVPTRPRWATTELPTTAPSTQVPTSTITPEATTPGTSTPTSTPPGSPTGSPDPYSEPITPGPGETPTHTLTPYPNPLEPITEQAVPAAPTAAPVG